MKQQSLTRANSFLKKVGMGLVGLAAMAALSSRPAQAQNLSSLPIGCWAVNGNGHQGSLCIQTVSGGEVFGTIYNGEKIRGFWNSTTKELVFKRLTSAGQFNNQVWTGYLFANPIAGGFKYRLGGSFLAFAEGGGGSSGRHVLGWQAEINRSF